MKAAADLEAEVIRKAEWAGEACQRRAKNAKRTRLIDRAKGKA